MDARIDPAHRRFVCRCTELLERAFYPSPRCCEWNMIGTEKGRQRLAGTFALRSMEGHVRRVVHSYDQRRPRRIADGILVAVGIGCPDRRNWPPEPVSVIGRILHVEPGDVRVGYRDIQEREQARI